MNLLDSSGEFFSIGDYVVYGKSSYLRWGQVVSIDPFPATRGIPGCGTVKIKVVTNTRRFNRTATYYTHNGNPERISCLLRVENIPIRAQAVLEK